MRYLNETTNRINKLLGAALCMLLLIISMPNAGAKIISADNPAMLKSVGIPTYIWKDDAVKNPKAVIVGFHGGCLHGRSYDALARELADRDMTFVSFDMRGYGKWYHQDFGGGQSKTFNYTQTIEDVRKLLTTLRAKHPNTPIYCIGESLGANFGLVIGARMPQKINGLILVSPFFAAKKFVDPRFLVTTTQALVLPTKELDMSPYLRKRLAHDQELAEAQINDPMSRDKQTPKELAQSYAINMSGRRYAKTLSPDLAVLVVHGEKDKLCSPKATVKMFEKLPTRNKRLVLLPNQGHLVAEASEVCPEIVATVSSWVGLQSNMYLANQKAAARARVASAAARRKTTASRQTKPQRSSRISARRTTIYR
jgi:alpha-beta hydrolase superfamily lysophospholipase